MEGRRPRTKFSIETALAVTSALPLILTLISPEWLEVVFGVDPDHGSGAAEWLIVGICAASALLCSVLARSEWRRPQRADALGGA